MFHPPRSDGLRFDRRASTVPQAVATKSTVMPGRRSRSAVTWLIVCVAGMSVGLMITTGSPAWPASVSARRAAARSAGIFASPWSLPIGVPQTRKLRRVSRIAGCR